MKILNVDVFDLYGNGTLVLKTNMDEEKGMKYAWYVSKDGENIYKSAYQLRPFMAYEIEQWGEYEIKAFVKSKSGEKLTRKVLYISDRKTSPALEPEMPVEPEAVPAAVEKAPVVVEEAPAAVEEAPAAVEEAPAAVEEAPAAVEEAPAEEAPVEAESEPAAEVESQPAEEADEAAEPMSEPVPEEAPPVSGTPIIPEEILAAIEAELAMPEQDGSDAEAAPARETEAPEAAAPDFAAEAPEAAEAEAPEAEEEVPMEPRVEAVGGNFWRFYMAEEFPRNTRFAWYIYRYGTNVPVKKVNYSSIPEYIYRFEESGKYRVKVFINRGEEKTSAFSRWFTI